MIFRCVQLVLIREEMCVRIKVWEKRESPPAFSTQRPSKHTLERRPNAMDFIRRCHRENNGNLHWERDQDMMGTLCSEGLRLVLT